MNRRVGLAPAVRPIAATRTTRRRASPCHRRRRPPSLAFQTELAAPKGQQPISLVLVGGGEYPRSMLAGPDPARLIGPIAPDTSPCRPGAQCSDQTLLGPLKIGSIAAHGDDRPVRTRKRPREEILPTAARTVN